MVVTKLDNPAETGSGPFGPLPPDRERSGRSRAALWRGLRALGFGALAVTVGFAALPGSAQTGTTTSTTAAPTTTTEATTSSTEATTTTESTSTSTSATTAPPTSATTAPPTTAAPTTTGSTSAGGSSTTASSTATTLDPERQKLEAAAAAKAREVDAANAKLGDLTDALASLQSQIEVQAAEVEIATQEVATAEAMARAAEEEVAELEDRVIELEYGLSDQAIRSFKGGVVEEDVLSVGNDPTQTIRKQAMLAKATQSDIDYVNALAGVREDLAARRADADAAVARAEDSQRESEEKLAALETDRLAQGQLTSAAEQRLDHLLSERAALARLGADSNVDAADTDALVKQLANTPAPAPRSTGSSAPPPVSGNDIRVAGKGIEVHKDIVDQVRQLLADAAADGVDLAGGGYRDPNQQIAVRKNNCGTSNYAIYEMPSSRCRPPTARPGRSQHEQGKAIDFTHNGKLIRSRSGAGWNWLNANANKYGLYNLPSEPWHWSVNGR